MQTKTTLAKHGGNIREVSAQTGIPAEDILDFSANINPLGPPEGVLRALRENLHLAARYPDPANADLTRAVAARLGIEADQVTMGNGVTEIIFRLVHLIKPRRVMVTAPAFSEYARAAQAAGAQVIEHALPAATGFRLDPAELCEKLAGIDILFLCNPHNPVGSLTPPATVSAVLAHCRHTGTLAVVDESFMDFVANRDVHSVVPYATRHQHVLVLYSLTKFYALAGLRLGCAVAHRELIDRLEACRDPWSVNGLAQLAGVTALRDNDFSTRTHRWLRDELNFLSDQLRDLPGIRPLPTEVNFMLIDIADSGLESTQLTTAMARRGVLVRDCCSFNGLGHRHIRVAVKDRTANEQLLQVLKDVLSQEVSG